MKQKLITFLSVASFFIIFWGVFGHEYLDFYNSQKRSSAASQNISQQMQDFSIERIEDISRIELFVTPSEDFLDMFIEKINTAKDRVYVEVYIFTEKRSREAIIQAHTRGVDVKVLLEKNPYMAPNLNNQTYNIFEEAGIDVRWSNGKVFPLNHAKFYIMDDELILSTGNLSYSSFTKNRDFYLSVADTSLVSDFENIFLGDFAGRETFVYDSRIILSPLYSRMKIMQLVSWAEKSIDMYFQYLSDNDLQDLLVLQESKGVQVRIIMDKKFIRENPDEVSHLEKKWVEFFSYNGTTMHAKSILIDKKILYIGSVNFSTYSFDSNRETGLLITNKDIVWQFQTQFLDDTITRQK